MKRSEIKALFPEATKDQIDSIMDLHGEGLESIKGQYKDYVPKADLDTVVAELTALKTAPKQMPTAEELTELETLRKFKTDAEAKQLIDRKTAALTKALEGEKVDPKALKFIVKEFDLNAIELDDGGAVKGFDELLKPIKADNSDFFGIEIEIGAKPGNPPPNTNIKADPFLEGFNSTNYIKKS